METWGVIFLGIIAFSSAIQGLFLVALLVFGRRLAHRIDALGSRIDKDITPALEDFQRVSRAAAEIADIGALQARRIDLVLGDTIDRVEEATSALQRFVSRPLRPLGTAVALFKGLQRGVEVFVGHDRGHDRGHDGPRHSRRRRHGGEDDEHLFI
jgi:hypothetical protein